MSLINLHHLKYFIDAAQGEGISASARKNFVSQSAVSRAISSLERDLEVELVLHRKNHFQLTEAGEAVLEKSHLIFETLARLKDTATEHACSLRGPLRFGCNPAIASRLAAPALTQMACHYPEIKPEMKLGNTDQIQQMLDHREIDFGIVVDDGEVETTYETRKIFSDRLLVVRSPKFIQDPFQNFIVSRTKKGGFAQSFFRQYEKAYGKPLAPKLVVPSWQVILDLAIEGYGAALVPEFMCKEALRLRKLEIVRHKLPSVPFDLCTLVCRNRSLPKNARAFFEFFGRKSAD